MTVVPPKTVSTKAVLPTVAAPMVTSPEVARQKPEGLLSSTVNIPVIDLCRERRSDN